MHLQSFGGWLKNNAITLLLTSFTLVLIVSPDAKGWVLQQLVAVGLFKPRIEKEGIENLPVATSFLYANEAGEQHSTAELRGKVVFINFWASWCPPCLAEMPSIETLYKKLHKDDRFVFLLINEDDDKLKAKNFLEKNNYTIPLFSASGPMPVDIFSGSLPTTIVLDKNGKIVLKKEGMAGYDTDEFLNQLKDLL